MKQTIYDVAQAARNSGCVKRVIGRTARLDVDKKQIHVGFHFSDDAKINYFYDWDSYHYIDIVEQLTGHHPKKFQPDESVVTPDQRYNSPEDLAKRFPKIFANRQYKGVARAMHTSPMPAFCEWPNKDCLKEDLQVRHHKAFIMMKNGKPSKYTYRKLYDAFFLLEHPPSKDQMELYLKELEQEDDMPYNEEGLGLLEFLYEKKEFIEFIKKRA